MRSTEYKKYLDSPKWQITREKWFAKYGKWCRVCGVQSPITLHHLTYENFGRENMSDLVALCFTCHARLESFYRKRGRGDRRSAYYQFKAANLKRR